MNLCRSESDENEENKKKRRLDKSSGTNEKGKKKKNLKDDDTCPIHGRHRWSECSLNPRSVNYGR